MSEERNRTQREKHRRSAAVFTAVAFLVILLLFITGKYLLGKEPSPLSAEFQTMGTLAKVTVYSSENDLITACELCQREFENVTALCSVYDAKSELSRLNAMAASAPFACSKEMWTLLMRAKKAYEESSGNFDITVKPLMDLWGVYRKRNTIPSDEEIANVMKSVGFDKLEFDEKARTILFTVPGMALDMGGIGKGYAADRAAEALAAANIRAGVIDIGGNLRMLPEPPPGKKFYHVAMRDPKRRNSILPDMLKIAPGMAVATSGNYERFVIFDGKKYGHLLSPITGSPAAVTAVTAVAPTAMDADVFSTSCAIGGESAANRIKEQHSDVKIHFAR